MACAAAGTFASRDLLRRRHADARGLRDAVHAEPADLGRRCSPGSSTSPTPAWRRTRRSGARSTAAARRRRTRPTPTARPTRTRARPGRRCVARVVSITSHNWPSGAHGEDQRNRHVGVLQRASAAVVAVAAPASRCRIAAPAARGAHVVRRASRRRGRQRARRLPSRRSRRRRGRGDSIVVLRGRRRSRAASASSRASG